MSGVAFSNLNSSNSQLYLAPDTINWVAVLLPANSTYKENTIDLPTAVSEMPYLLFANSAPTDVADFVDRIRTYLDTFRTRGARNITSAWCQSIDETPSASNIVAWNAQEVTQGNYASTTDFNFTFGNNYCTLFIQANSSVNIVANDDTTELNVVLNSTQSNITLRTNKVTSESKSLGNLSIPFQGDGAGSFRWLFGLNMASDFHSFEMELNYYFPQSGQTDPENFIYPIFKPGNLNEFVVTQTAIDPNNIIGELKDIPRSYMAVTGEMYNDSELQNSPLSLESYWALNTGQPISLIPKINFEETKAAINNLYPTKYSPRFVFSPQDKAAKLTYYLQPQGKYYLDPGPEAQANADENGQFDLIPGLSGTETISFTPYKNDDGTITGDCISFQSQQPSLAPNFPPPEISLAQPGTNQETLLDTYFTSWANIVSDTPDNVQYVSQPEGASLYALNHGVSEDNTGKPNLLGFFEPSIGLPQSEDFFVPMVPYLGVDTSSVGGVSENINSFESQVLSKERKFLIAGTADISASQVSKSKAKRESLATTSDFTIATTPQGLLTNVKNDGKWSLLNLGQNSLGGSPNEYLYPTAQEPNDPSQYQLSFLNLTKQLQSAFLTNQQFLVVTQKSYLGQLMTEFLEGGGTPFTATDDATFNNKMSIVDWPFDLNVGTSNTYADYNNVFIFKFCTGSILDRVKNPKTWTEAETFNTNGVSDDNEAYQQLVAISQWIQNYITDAENAYQVGVEQPDTNQKILYQKFIDIVNNDNWNGILALKVDIDLTEFPQQLKGLISGIDLKRFNAHHFGVEISKVTVDDGDPANKFLKMEKNSSLFGLINYLDTAYERQLLQGLNPEMPVLPTPGVDYEFKVLQLQVLFENTAIKFFQSKVQLTMNELFADSVTGTNNSLGAGSYNTVVLDGTYQDHDNTPVYIFENTENNLFYFDSNLLKNVQINKIQFNTLTTDPAATEIDSRFSMWGYLNFAEMESTIPYQDKGPKTTKLDAFSFGNSDGSTGDIMQGLNYSSLYVNMSFNIDTPTVVTYGFDAGQIAFNSNQSTTRKLSLYPNFALQINNLVSGTKDKQPSDMGYLNLATPGIDINGLPGDWYGMEMTLNMGTPGELAASLDFNSSLLIAWSPGPKTGANDFNAFVGIKLPGTSSNAKLLSLQGVLKLSIDTLKLEYVPDSSSYMMTLSNIALKFLGILKLPPGGNTNFLLFGNPNEGATAKSLGWYAAYQQTPSE